jgi:hypothetical protein
LLALAPRGHADAIFIGRTVMDGRCAINLSRFMEKGTRDSSLRCCWPIGVVVLSNGLSSGSDGLRDRDDREVPAAHGPRGNPPL